jgi:hypothetical protein
VQVVLIDDQQPVKELAAQGAGQSLADGVGSGCLRRAGENPDACGGEHSVEGVSELACAVPDQELNGICALAEAHQQVARRLCRPLAVGVGGDACEVNAAGAVLNDDQGIDAPEEHGIHVHEVGRQDAAGLRLQELLPGRAGAAGRRVEPGIMQDLPDRGGSDRGGRAGRVRLARAGAPRWDCRWRCGSRACGSRLPSRAPMAGVVPFARDQATVPGQQRTWGHREHLAPSASGISRDSSASHSRSPG